MQLFTSFCIKRAMPDFFFFKKREWFVNVNGEWKAHMVIMAPSVLLLRLCQKRSDVKWNIKEGKIKWIKIVSLMIRAFVFINVNNENNEIEKKENNLAWFHSLSHPAAISGTLAFAFLLFDVALRVNTFGWLNTVKYH